MEPEIHNPFFFYRGHRFEAIVGARGEYEHAFGASGGFNFQGMPADKRGLHQLLTLDTRDPVLRDIFPGVPNVPIFYGFHYESGLVEYDLIDAATVHVNKLDVSSYEERWPYLNYPASFPVLPLTLTQPAPCDLATFKKEVWQGIEPRFANHFIAIVPSSDSYGVHLWHEDNNFDDIHVKFFFDPATRHAVVYNECD